MSGQPIRTQADANKFRNEYMETLDLQDEINDYNLQANKTYLLTGALPPQSQMQDTRTNAEKLRDVEGMKQNVAEQLRPIAEPQFAYAIVDKIINSPLNIDNSLFRFLAQRAESIAEQLKKILPYGIAGDENDLLRIVEYIKNMYSETQGKFQTTKSYMNSIGSQSSSSKVLSGNDIDNIIIALQDIIKNIDIISRKNINVGRIINAENVINRLRPVLLNLKNSLPTTEQVKLLLNDIENPIFNNPYPEIGVVQNMSYSSEDLEAFFKLIEKLPKYTEVMALINKIKQFLESGNYNLVVDGLRNLEKMFMGVEGIANTRILNKFQSIKKRQQYKQEQANKLEAEQTRQFIQNQSEEQKNISKAQKVYIVNPEDDAVWVRGSMNLGSNMKEGSLGSSQTGQSNVSSLTNTSSFGSNFSGSLSENVRQMRRQIRVLPLDVDSMSEISNALDELEKRAISAEQSNDEEAIQEVMDDIKQAQVELRSLDKTSERTFSQPSSSVSSLSSNSPSITLSKAHEEVSNALLRGNFDRKLKEKEDKVAKLISEARAIAGSKKLSQEEKNIKIDNIKKQKKVLEDEIDKMKEEGENKIGKGIRRGRPRGGGIKPIVEVQKQPTFIGFGINEINQKQLNNGIVKIRRNTKSNYMDMPSKRVSSNLQGIIKTIVGGGVPKFNELNSLDEDEKEYLHKIISRSNLEDKLSVPAPSKDQQEKDIHNFEVMRGQLMSGNDSQELVKKFKLLIRKLSKQNLLPKADVEDLLETLADLGY